ncbi:MAG: TonB-dependent receptor plug domain-containing protein, partial [Ferruginibacter sp.]|nr:TonB-dependent receptor plug domain-containing protein [Chitinophagaceae bacterium]
MKKLFIILFAGVLILPASAQEYKGARAKSQEEKLNEEYCTGLFKSAEGTILDVSSSTNAGGYTNVLDWLQGRVAGLQIYTSGTGVTIPVIRGTVPGIYIDEIPVSLNSLGILNINDIAIIKVIKNPFYGGFNGSGGAIAIYTLGG